uniref:CDP-glucose 4,6-dehydratase n=1 Tax=Fulvivirga sp. TaxID=1931237 RepID=UPI004049EB3C
MSIDLKLNTVDPLFWNGKRVFLTGHTGFKGGWISVWLAAMGAKVFGYSLAANTVPSYFNAVGIQELLEQNFISDVRDLSKLRLAIKMSKPEVLIHMAAQPLVRYSFHSPVETFSTNVMGTVNVLEAAREIESIKSIVVVTTDKCYENQEWVWGYRENEPLGGADPYSSSKACAELVTSAYRQSFFSGNSTSSNAALASARAGNVIGGGDWSVDRLIPDAITAFEADEPLVIRNPLATRPWQHVLEPLSGYLMLAQALFDRGRPYASSWNFGPGEEGNKTVEQVIDILSNTWGSKVGWEQDYSAQPLEAHLLKLDCSKAHHLLHWAPKWKLDQSIEKVVQWHKALKAGKDMKAISLEQINDYISS